MCQKNSEVVTEKEFDIALLETTLSQKLVFDGPLLLKHRRSVCDFQTVFQILTLAQLNFSSPLNHQNTFLFPRGKLLNGQL